ncbi:MAG: ECF transporter S component [Syntrophaceticus schinkii]
MNKRRILFVIGLLVAVVVLFWIGIVLYKDRAYNLISIILMVLACVPFYTAYEKKEGDIRRMVIVATMTALAVVGRFVFAPVPYFKPVTAIVIITAIYLGSEAGFLVGSLSAIISNIFFGQGPWTPFQMVAWGVIGLIAGIPPMKRFIKTKPGLIIYGILSGILFSAIMDIWTVLSYDGTFSWARYLAAQIMAIQVTITYAISNVVFLLIGMKPIGTKLERIQIKHRIFINE